MLGACSPNICLAHVSVHAVEVIIVFALASIAVTQNLESEVFPRLFMWAYGLNAINATNPWRPEFRQILNYTLSLVLKLGFGLDHHFFFNQGRGLCDTEEYDSSSDDEDD